MAVPSNILIDLGLIIILATVLAYLAQLIKQPLIPAYILAGVILGPIGLGFVKDIELIRALSEIGIAFLLFLVGLEINIKKIKNVAGIALFGGLIQIILTFLVGFFIGQLMGFQKLTSVYIGLIITFSSTMIVVKLLSDKGHINTLHGRILLGILLVQDLVAVFALSFLTKEELNGGVIITSIIQGAILIGAVFLLSRFLLKKVFDFAAKSRELIFLIAISLCFLFAILAYLLDFSIAIGAFMIGVGLANLPYNYEIVGRVVSLKDFFSTIFFVSLGMQLVMISTELLVLLLVLVLAVILLKPLIVMIITSIASYETRTAFLTSLSLGQVSEFSLLLGSIGFYVSGHLSQEFFSLIVFLTVITMVITSYLIKYSSGIYDKLSWFLRLFGVLSTKKKKLGFEAKDNKHKVVLFGCNRMGKIFLRTLGKANVLVIDHDPGVIGRLIKSRTGCYYGEMNNYEILKKINFMESELVISTIEDIDNNLSMIRHVKGINDRVRIFVSAKNIGDALDLYERGADYVIIPHVFSAEAMGSLFKKVSSGNFSKIRTEHIQHLIDLESGKY
ncbi:MAG: cation:proton antiporter [Candidatus Nanoarchaeia archaeon]|nr:cation:proton antiporter [Candidatus Nanoarchaeia archaeon]